jgi:hypothetical protein
MGKNAIVLVPPRALEPNKLAVARRAAAPLVARRGYLWRAQTGGWERAANRPKGASPFIA